MGLDRVKRTPCGFCFVEYLCRKDTEMAVRTINGTCLDDRLIRCDFDWGFVEGRQLGRGLSGGQVRHRVYFFSLCFCTNLTLNCFHAK